MEFFLKPNFNLHITLNVVKHKCRLGISHLTEPDAKGNLLFVNISCKKPNQNPTVNIFVGLKLGSF